MKIAAKWLALSALAASGVFAFACGGGDASTNTNTTPSASATQTSAPSATETATASASTAPVASSAPPVAPPEPLAIAAMKITGTKLKGTLELKDDGTVLSAGKPVAKIVGAELQDSSGKTLVAVGGDNSVTITGSQKGAKFDDKNDLQIDGGAKMSIGDDGVVKLFNADGKADKDSGKIKIAGFKPTARRAATVVVMGVMLMAPSKK
jgi:hypothetical protein